MLENDAKSPELNLHLYCAASVKLLWITLIAFSYDFMHSSGIKAV